MTAMAMTMATTTIGMSFSFEMKMLGFPVKNSQFFLSSTRVQLFFCVSIVGCLSLDCFDLVPVVQFLFQFLTWIFLLRAVQSTSSLITSSLHLENRAVITDLSSLLLQQKLMIAPLQQLHLHLAIAQCCLIVLPSTLLLRSHVTSNC